MDSLIGERLSTIKLFRCNVAFKEVAWQEHGQKYRFLENQARDCIKNSIGPRLKESHGVSDYVTEDGSCYSESDQQLHYFVGLVVIIAIDDVRDLAREVSDSKKSVSYQ